MSPFITDLWSFAKERKRWWLFPLFILIVAVGIIVVFAQTTVVPPLPEETSPFFPPARPNARCTPSNWTFSGL